jgi:tetratricopeptide (TPR) repeat protein
MESGKGTLSHYDLATRKSTEIARLPGFTRGLHILGDLAFIGVSKVRESATFSGLPITKLPKRVAGVWVVNINSGTVVTFIEFTEGIDEVFAVSALPYRHMELFDFSHPLSHSSYMVDDEDLEEVKMPETPIELAAPHFDKGNDLYTEGRKEEAIEEFRKALDIQPDYLPAKFNIAIALGDLEHFDEAIRILRDVIDKDASIAEAYNSMGYVYYRKGDWENARKQFETAIDIKPGYQQARNSLDILKKKMEQKSKTSGDPEKK